MTANALVWLHVYTITRDNDGQTEYNTVLFCYVLPDIMSLEIGPLFFPYLHGTFQCVQHTRYRRKELCDTGQTNTTHIYTLQHHTNHSQTKYATEPRGPTARRPAAAGMRTRRSLRRFVRRTWPTGNRARQQRECRAANVVRCWSLAVFVRARADCATPTGPRDGSIHMLHKSQSVPSVPIYNVGFCRLTKIPIIQYPTYTRAQQQQQQRLKSWHLRVFFLSSCV